LTDRADRFTVLLDANVIAGALPRNILLSLAEAGLFRPRWSAQILNEFEAYFTRQFNDQPAAARQRQRIEEAFPEAEVANYEVLTEAIDLPDKDDCHVVAAAIHTKASLIVTDNLKDFPPEVLAQYDLEAVSLDNFLADLLDLAGAEAIAAIRIMRQRFQNPELDAEALIAKVEKCGLQETAKILYEYHALL